VLAQHLGALSQGGDSRLKVEHQKVPLAGGQVLHGNLHHIAEMIKK
jgi:hypothetical protein